MTTLTMGKILTTKWKRRVENQKPHSRTYLLGSHLDVSTAVTAPASSRIQVEGGRRVVFHAPPENISSGRLASPARHGLARASLVPMASNASHMLEAALEQMDDIITGKELPVCHCPQQIAHSETVGFERKQILANEKRCHKKKSNAADV